MRTRRRTIMSSLGTAIVVNAALAVALDGQSSGRDLCESLRAAIDDAPKQFASLKGPRDRYEATFYLTPWRLPGTTEDDCFVSHDEDSGYDISCSVRAPSFEAAMQKAQSWAAEVERCLAASGKYIASEWRNRGLSTRSSTSRVMSREFFVPTEQEAYDVRIDVNGGCRTSRRGERCSTELLVELTGDER